MTSLNLVSRDPDGGFIANVDQDTILSTIASDPEVMVCDFCSDSPVVYEHEATDFTFGKFGDDTHNSLGSWMACATCDVLIVSGDRQRLLHHSLNRFMDNHATMSGTEIVVAGIGVETAHKLFWKHRNGTRRRI